VKELKYILYQVWKTDWQIYHKLAMATIIWQV